MTLYSALLFTVSLERLSRCVVCSHTFHLQHKSNLFIANRMYRWAFMFLGNLQGNKKGPRFIQQNTFRLTKSSAPARDWCVVEIKQGVDKRVYPPHTKDIQRTAISQMSSEGTEEGGMSQYLKTPKHLHTVQTNLPEKLKGWHSQCWTW